MDTSVWAADLPPAPSPQELAEGGPRPRDPGRSLADFLKDDRYCTDCGMATTPHKGSRGRWEYYIVHDRVWHAAHGPLVSLKCPVTGPEFTPHWLCIGCLEERLGRSLIAADFLMAGPLSAWTRAPRVLWSPRLLARVSDRRYFPPGAAEVSPAQFAAAFERAMAASPYRAFAASYSVKQIRAARLTRVLTADGQAGVAIWDRSDGAIQVTALFNGSGTRGLGFALLELAVRGYWAGYAETYAAAPGHRYLAALGFGVAKAVPFDPALAPQGWDYERFGTPDYLVMTRPEPVRPALPRPPAGRNRPHAPAPPTVPPQPPPEQARPVLPAAARRGDRPCHDCGQPTTPRGQRELVDPGTYEWFMVKDAVWREAGGPEEWTGYYLHVACLERRLDRELVPSDFLTGPGVLGLWAHRWHRWKWTPTLRDRVEGGRAPDHRDCVESDGALPR